MRIRLGLNILNDLDLLTLNGIPKFHFKFWVGEALRVYVDTGETLRTPLPAVPAGLTLRSVMLSITFGGEKDAEVEGWLKALKHKQRSGAIKSVLRCSLMSPCLFAHVSSYPADFQPLPPEGVRITGKTAIRGTSDKSVEIAAPSEAIPVQAFPAQAPESEPGVFDIFSLDLDEP